MTRSVVFASEAQDDLFQLYDHIASDAGAERARNYTDRIMAARAGLATFPERGTRRDDLRPGLRIVTFRRRVTIAFHITATTVTIDRVLCGGRDLTLLFGSDEDTCRVAAACAAGTAAYKPRKVRMPKGYIYAELDVTDPALFETYRPLAAASIAAFGGRYAIRGGDPKVLEGNGSPPRSVLLEFDSPERAMEWYNSPQYQAALQIRLRSARTKVVMLTGNSEG